MARNDNFDGVSCGDQAHVRSASCKGWAQQKSMPIRWTCKGVRMGGVKVASLEKATIFSRSFLVAFSWW